MKGLGIVYFEAIFEFNGPGDCEDYEVVNVTLNDKALDELPKDTQDKILKEISNQIEDYIESTKDYDPD